ncbi:MAG: hypothetical protein IPN77_33065, partial [Sandaracinaceae bacterium]|nr:hypothetical protein [Sandaracinaceae bacterium]
APAQHGVREPWRPGDTCVVGPASAERVARGTLRTHTQQAEVVRDVLTKDSRGLLTDAEAVAQLRALIAGTSPDEAKALRKAPVRPGETESPDHPWA